MNTENAVVHQEDFIKMRGCLEIAMKNMEGEVVRYEKNDNVVVTAGRAWVLMRIQSSSPDANTIGYLGVGTGTAAPTTGDTALGSEVTRKAIGTFSYATASNPPSWQAQVSFNTNEANTTLAEAGLFNSSAAGTMLSHVTFASIAKATSNTLSISYTLSN